MPDIKSYNLIHTCSLVCYQKKNHQKIQRLKCKNKKNASSSPKDVIYSLVLQLFKSKYGFIFCAIPNGVVNSDGYIIGYKSSVPGTNLVIKDASNLGERFTFKFGGSHPRGEQEDVTTDKENNKNKIKQNI